MIRMGLGEKTASHFLTKIFYTNYFQWENFPIYGSCSLYTVIHMECNQKTGEFQ